jgi:hypothetical protein
VERLSRDKGRESVGHRRRRRLRVAGGGYEVGALVGLRGPITGRGNVELGDVFRLPQGVWRSFHVGFYYSRTVAHRKSYGVFLIAHAV